MGKAFLLLVFLQIFTTFASANTQNSEGPSVLLTAFEPFGGSSSNNSIAVANATKRRLEARGIRVQVCILPVVYDVGAQRAMRCLNAMNPRPTMVLSMGEGGCGGPRLETAAHNQDSAPGFPDNAGNIRSQSTIVPNGPQSIGFNMPVIDMYCTMPPSARGIVRISETPGGFVCNNVAYRLAHDLGDTPYSFIHVRPSTCTDSGRLQQDSIVISDLISAGLRTVQERSDSLHSSARLRSHNPPVNCEQRLPTSLQEIANLQAMLQQQSPPDRACRNEFLNRLSERLTYGEE